MHQSQTPYDFRNQFSGTKIHFFNEKTSTLHIFVDETRVNRVQIDATGSVNTPTIDNPDFLDSIKQAAFQAGLIGEFEEIALIC